MVVYGDDHGLVPITTPDKRLKSDFGIGLRGCLGPGGWSRAPLDSGRSWLSWETDYDRVVVRLDRLPAFEDRSVADEALAVRGTYVVVTGVALRHHLLSK